MQEHETGLVAFFDILGYQNIVRNNDISAVTRLIDELLVDLPIKAKQHSPLFGEPLPQDENPLSSVRTLVISDSIIIVMPLRSRFDEDWVFTYFTWLFAKYCSALLDFAFTQGLPLRGAMDYGEFYLTHNCFAGRPLIDCYQMTHLLDFSGCVLTPGLDKMYHSPEDAETVRFYSREAGFPYLCPLTSAKTQRFFTLG